jgi:hypothetical protein
VRKNTGKITAVRGKDCRIYFFRDGIRIKTPRNAQKLLTKSMKRTKTTPIKKKSPKVSTPPKKQKSVKRKPRTVPVSKDVPKKPKIVKTKPVKTSFVDKIFSSVANMNPFKESEDKIRSFPFQIIHWSSSTTWQAEKGYVEIPESLLKKHNLSNVILNPVCGGNGCVYVSCFELTCDKILKVHHISSDFDDNFTHELEVGKIAAQLDIGPKIYDDWKTSLIWINSKGIRETHKFRFTLMEKLDMDLIHFIAHRGANTGGKIPLTEDHIRELQSYQEKLFKSGILHQDWKPENIMLSIKDNKIIRFYVIDFGLSLFLKDFESKPALQDQLIREDDRMFENLIQKMRDYMKRQ